MAHARQSAVRIAVVGDAGVGKTSLISTAANDVFDGRPAPVLPPTRLPAESTPDHVPMIVTDTSSRAEDQQASDRCGCRCREAQGGGRFKRAKRRIFFLALQPASGCALQRRRAALCHAGDDVAVHGSPGLSLGVARQLFKPQAAHRGGAEEELPSHAARNTGGGPGAAAVGRGGGVLRRHAPAHAGQHPDALVRAHPDAQPRRARHHGLLQGRPARGKGRGQHAARGAPPGSLPAAVHGAREATGGGPPQPTCPHASRLSRASASQRGSRYLLQPTRLYCPSPRPAMPQRVEHAVHDLPHVEVCLNCSAKTLRMVADVFFYALKSVLYPLQPLYDRCAPRDDVPRREACMARPARTATTGERAHLGTGRGQGQAGQMQNDGCVPRTCQPGKAGASGLVQCVPQGG